MGGDGPEQDVQIWSFRFGDAFPADDPLARFVVVVALGLNDNTLSHTRLVAAEEAYERLYFFHLASGHLFGLADELSRAHEEWSEIRAFVATLDEQYRNDFDAIVGLASSDDTTGTRLRAIRNRFFHYPSLRRRSAERGWLPLQRALRDLSELDAEVRAGAGGLGGGIRALFADDVLVNLMTREIDEDEIAGLLATLGDLQAGYNRFAQAAVGRYLRNLPRGVVTLTAD